MNFENIIIINDNNPPIDISATERPDYAQRKR